MRTPPFIVVMGVAGSGKSTVGRHLASDLGVPLLDADDLHPAVNVEKMAAGMPLEDADRWPWLGRVGEEGRALAARAGGVVVACSALRRSYRDVLRQHGVTRFVHLDADADVLAERLRARPDHFMGASMLDGQLATLEAPAPDEVDVVRVDVTDRPPDAVVGEVMRRLQG